MVAKWVKRKLASKPGAGFQCWCWPSEPGVRLRHGSEIATRDRLGE
jgi:hypothetical protein